MRKIIGSILHIYLASFGCRKGEEERGVNIRDQCSTYAWPPLGVGWEGRGGEGG